MSDTPRTDAEVSLCRHDEIYRRKPGYPSGVRSDFARTLEREIAELLSGDRIVLPQTVEHARAMHRVASVALEHFGEGSPQKKTS